MNPPINSSTAQFPTSQFSTSQFPVPSGSPQFASPQQIIQKILYFGKITAVERQWLLQAGISELMLSESELAQIRQIHDRLRMGLIKVVDS